MGPKYLLITLGCKVNQYESQQIREVLRSMGLTPAHPGEQPAIAVVNTCAVTGSASRKNRQAIRRVSRGGATLVYVVGCGATADAEQLRTIQGVTAVLGHDVDVCGELRRLIGERLGSSPPTSPPGDHKDRRVTRTRPEEQRHDVWMIPPSPVRGTPPTRRTTASTRESIPRSLPVVKSKGQLVARIERLDGHQRAFLKVQDGCDARCTYCIIPQLRPALRSKPAEVAVEEARTLVAHGHKEIILTGIFLGAYGRETAIRRRFGSGRSPLAGLVGALAGVDGLERLRLSSLEPGDVDGALLEVLASNPCCVPHLHLPLQSGSGAVLRRMNRQYTRDEFLGMIDRVRDALDRPAISTDIIVGFPGEDEPDFKASCEVARIAEFCKIHAFPFSPRSRTAAARWHRQFVPPAVVRERMNRLAEIERACSLAFRERFIGDVERVIVEDGDASNAGGGTVVGDGKMAGIRAGRADRYFEIHFETNGMVSAGDVVRVRVDRVTPTRTHGVIVRKQDGSTPPHVQNTVEPNTACA